MSPSDTEPPNPSPPPSPSPEVAQLRETVAHLERRVAALEAAGASNTVQPSVKSATADRFGLKLVNRIGAVTLALGIIFFFKYAIDSAWMGASARVLLGLLVGVGLLLSADWLRRRGQQVFAQGLAGCGMGTLYISIYSASAYYRLLSEPVAFVALFLLCGVTLFLAIRFASQASAALAFLGALLTPVLLRFLEPDSWAVFDFAYLLLLLVTGLLIAGLQDWPILAPLVAALAWIAALVQINPQHPALFVSLLGAAALFYFFWPRFLKPGARVSACASVVAHCALLLALLRVCALWVQANVAADDRVSVLSETGSVLIALYGIAILIYGIARRSLLHRTFALSLIGIVVAKLYCYDVWQLTRVYRISAFMALGVLLLTASYVYSRSKAS